MNMLQFWGGFLTIKTRGTKSNNDHRKVRKHDASKTLMGSSIVNFPKVKIELKDSINCTNFFLSTILSVVGSKR